MPPPVNGPVASAATDALFQSIKLGAIDLKHRIVMAPLTRCRAIGNMPNDLMRKYYEQRTTEGGLLITEATVIEATGHGYPCTPAIDTPERVRAWREIAQAVHGKGGKIVMQIWHCGRASHPHYQPNQALPIAPSALGISPALGFQCFSPKTFQNVDYVTPRALGLKEIPTVIDHYRRGAANALEAGFDGVEIHGASGYLIEQFLKDTSNRRSDAYGGSIENRCRFALEVVNAVRGEVGANRTALRLSPFNDYLMGPASDSHPYALYTYLLEELNAMGLAYVHMVEDRYDVPNPGSLDGFRKAYRGTLMRASGYTAETAATSVEGGQADLIAFGRHFISTPDLVKRVRLGKPFNAYDRDTFYAQTEIGYTDYPFLD